MLHLQVLDGRHGQVQVRLLWYRAVRPGRFRQMLDLLKGQLGDAVGSPQHQPVAAALVDSPRLWQLITGPVDKTQQLSVELCQKPGVSAVEHHLPQTGRALRFGHVDHLP